MNVFVTGGTGYIGRELIATLVARGHAVTALVRAESTGKLTPGATPIVGDALDAATFAHAIPASSTLVHLVGTPHPNPSKGRNSSASTSRRSGPASMQRSAPASCT